MKETIRQILLTTGASAVGFAKAGEIDGNVADSYDLWIKDGCNAGMSYLHKHSSLRRHTDNVLEGANTVISLAFSYSPEKWLDHKIFQIACYAYGEDYHEVIRKFLFPKIEELKQMFGGKWRLCIDSAPVAERYWALTSGIGIKGDNGAVIVEGCGSLCFLAEILTSLQIEPDLPLKKDCGHCRQCIAACPTGALKNDGFIDSRLCINYLTIEKKDDFSDEEKNFLKRASYPLFGCDRCLKVCKHNHNIKPTSIKEFQLSESIKKISCDEILGMNELDFSEKFGNSPFKRSGLAGLKRNIQI